MPIVVIFLSAQDEPSMYSRPLGLGVTCRRHGTLARLDGTNAFATNFGCDLAAERPLERSPKGGNMQASLRAFLVVCRTGRPPRRLTVCGLCEFFGICVPRPAVAATRIAAMAASQIAGSTAVAVAKRAAAVRPAVAASQRAVAAICGCEAGCGCEASCGCGGAYCVDGRKFAGRTYNCGCESYMPFCGCTGPRCCDNSCGSAAVAVGTAVRQAAVAKRVVAAALVAAIAANHRAAAAIAAARRRRLLPRILRGLRADVFCRVRRRLLRLQRRSVLERMAQRSAAVLRSMQSLRPMGRPRHRLRRLWLWLWRRCTAVAAAVATAAARVAVVAMAVTAAPLKAATARMRVNRPTGATHGGTTFAAKQRPGRSVATNGSATTSSATIARKVSQSLSPHAVGPQAAAGRRSNKCSANDRSG